MISYRARKRSVATVIAAATAVILAAQVPALSTVAAAATANRGIATRIVNFDPAGDQVLKLDVDGNAVDAHDGKIVRFGQRYYLYGTSYDCGFNLLETGTPFCGFKVYSSPDLAHWTDRGFLFDARTPLWQERCASPRYGCYRPHVVYNAKTGKYVLWVNGYDNESNYHVFTADTPTGSFVEAPEPVVAANRGVGVGLNNGDNDVFVDDDGTAYLAYTDIRAGHRQKVERLDSTYTSGTGEVADLGVANTEAPAMFKRHGRYYVTYSDPTCAYCPSTGTSYMTATSPLGPWTGASQQADAWTTTGDHTLLVKGGGVGLSKAGADWTDYTMSFRAKPLQTANNGQYAQAGWAFRARDENTGYVWLLGNYPHPGAEGGSLTRIRIVDGQYRSVEVVPLPFPIVGGQSHDVSTVVTGSKIETRVDGRLIDSIDNTVFSAGRIGFRESSAEGESAEFDDVRVTAPDGRVLFSDDFSGDLSKWARPAPLQQGFKINQTSCGGQPSFVSVIPAAGDDAYLFGSDLWNGRPNQALAGYFWRPLAFRDDGSIAPYKCDPDVSLTLTAGKTGADRQSRLLDAHSTSGLFRPYADIGPNGYHRAQTFTVERTGKLQEVRVTTFQTGHPNAPLVLELARLGADGRPAAVVAHQQISADEIGWSAREVAIAPHLAVSAGDRLALVLRTDATQGAYGFGYDDSDHYAGGAELYAPGTDVAWVAEPQRDLRFEALVTRHHRRPCDETPNPGARLRPSQECP